jgi:hypothetical protein
MAGKVLGKQLVSGGDGRGGQSAPWARFLLMPGTYKVEVRYTSGVSRGLELVVPAVPVYSMIDDQTKTLN